MSAQLPIMYSTKDLLRSGDGGPVWPVRDENDVQALRTLAKVFDCELYISPASKRPSDHGDEWVLAMGAHLSESAALYANLTQRRAVVIESASELAAHPNAHVLLCSAEQLDIALLDEVWRFSRDRHTLGLVVAEDAAEMRRQVLLRSAAAWMCAPSPLPVVLLLAMAEFEAHLGAGLVLLGGAAPGPRIAETFDVGSGIVGMYVHGDGLDSHLGGNKLTCPVPSTTGGTPAHTPDCVTHGYCYRLRAALTEAVADKRLLDSAKLRCRIGVVLTCFGVPAAESLIPWHWSLLRSRLVSGLSGAVVTTLGLTTQAHPTLFQLTGDLAEGHSVGKAVRTSFDKLGENAKITRLYLFGDPRVTVPRAESSLTSIRALAANFAATEVAPLPDMGPMGACETRRSRAIGLKRLVASIQTSVDSEALEMQLAETAAAAIDDLLATSGPWSTKALAQVSTTTLAALAHVRAFQYVAGWGEGVHPLPGSGHCQWCHNRTRLMLRDQSGGIAHRIEHWCERCGVVLNAERGSPFVGSAFAFEAGLLVLDPRLREPGVHTTIIMEQPPSIPGVPVPTTWRGRHIECLDGGRQLRVAPELWMMRCTLLAMCDLELVMLQGMFRFAHDKVASS